MQTFCAWVAETALSTWVKESLWAFSVIVGLHIVALTFSVGTIVWFDLRLLGASLRSTAASKVYRQIIPFAWTGFVVMFVTGALLFIAYPAEAYKNVYFRMKLAAILLAGVNAFVYHRYSVRHAESVEAGSGPLPRGARIAGGISLTLWTLVVLAGRMISYTLYSH